MKNLIKVFLTISTLSLMVFILLGIIIVLIQAVAVITLYGQLAGSVGTLKDICIAASAILVICSFLYAACSKAEKKNAVSNE